MRRGTNNDEKGALVLKTDIGRLQSHMIVFSDSGHDCIWNSVRQELLEKLNAGARMVIVLSRREYEQARDSGHTTAMDQILAHPNVKPYFLDKRAPVDLRYIDDRHLYVGQHGEGEGRNRPYAQSEDEGTPEAELVEARKFILEFLPSTSCTVLFETLQQAA